jgi:hypothetical protein
MTNRHTATYRALLRAYPRSFRADYGAPMTQLFADRLNDVGAKAWLRTVPDLARSAPQQRMETVMSALSQFSPFTRFLALIAATGALGVAVVFGGGPGLMPWVLVAFIVVLFSQRRFFGSMFGGDRVPLRSAVRQAWWAPLAALMALVQIFFGTVNAVSAHNLGGRVFGSIILWATGAAMLYGLTRRPFARAEGNAMILLTSLPYFALFWAIVPPLMGVLLWVGVLSSGFDAERRTPAAVA